MIEKWPRQSNGFRGHLLFDRDVNPFEQDIETVQAGSASGPVLFERPRNVTDRLAENAGIDLR
jgi:hypothetical protein